MVISKSKVDGLKTRHKLQKLAEKDGNYRGVTERESLTKKYYCEKIRRTENFLMETESKEKKLKFITYKEPKGGNGKG